MCWGCLLRVSHLSAFLSPPTHCTDPPLCLLVQELCTLLRASHLSAAPPVAFLAQLHRTVSAMPWIVYSWSSAEQLELGRAFCLLRRHTQQLAGPPANSSDGSGSSRGE